MNETSLNSSEIISVVLEVINTLCSNLFSSIDETIFPLLDKLIFINNDIFSTGTKFNKLLSTSPSSGVLVLANSLFTAFVLYYAAKLIIANLTGSQIESPPKFFMRAFLAGVAMNSSVPICKFLITSTNLISSFFCQLGENIFCKEILRNYNKVFHPHIRFSIVHKEKIRIIHCVYSPYHSVISTISNFITYRRILTL